MSLYAAMMVFVHCFSLYYTFTRILPLRLYTFRTVNDEEDVLVRTDEDMRKSGSCCVGTV